MIIGTESPCKPGEIITGTYWISPTEKYPNTTFYVIREVTKEDWIEYRKSVGRPPMPTVEYGLYYEVSHD